MATFRLFEYPNVAGLNDFAIKKLERLVSNDEGRGVPSWQVTVNYLRMWAVQSGDELAGSVTEADKAKYSREYRSVTVEDASIKTQFPLAGTITVDTLLTTEADAQALAEHLLSLFGVRRDLFRLKASYDVPLAGAVDLGDVVKVYHPRFGFRAGGCLTCTAFNTTRGSLIWNLNYGGEDMALTTAPLIGFPRHTDDFTLTGSHWDSDYPVTNLQDLEFAKVARSTSLGAGSPDDPVIVQGTSASLVTVQCFGLAAHSLSLTATYRLQLYSDAGLTTQIYDSGIDPVWPVSYTDAEL